MNAYFFKMSKDEKNNILDQHKHLYDGYVTKYNQETNQQPLYVQDLANDKMGLTLNNKGTVKTYTNHKINESHSDKIGDGPSDFEHGTFNEDPFDSNDHEFMHDVLPSPNEDEFDYETFGTFDNEMESNDNQYEYDIDELEDYSSEPMDEVYDEEENNETWMDEEIIEDMENLSDVVSSVNESLDMFKRFKKYN